MAIGHSDVLTGMRGRLGGVIVYELNGQTVIRTRVYKQRRSRSDALTQWRTDFRGIASAWRGLDAGQKASWSRLASRMPDWDGARAKPGLTGYQCWLGVGTGRALLGLPLLPDAPATPDLPAFLPPPTLSATISGGALSLTFSCGASPFDAPVQILASRPYLPGEASVRDKDLVQIALLPGVPASGAQIGPEYASRWRAFSPGQSVTIRAVPLSPTGFRGQAVTAAAVIGE